VRHRGILEWIGQWTGVLVGALTLFTHIAAAYQVRNHLVKLTELRILILYGRTGAVVQSDLNKLQWHIELQAMTID